MSRYHNPLCKPGEGCFTCPLPDCSYGGWAKGKEAAMRKTGYVERVGGRARTIEPDGVYNCKPVPNDEEVLTGGVKTMKVGKEAVEAMLAELYPGQIRPVKVALHKTPPRRRSWNDGIYGKSLRE